MEEKKLVFQRRLLLFTFFLRMLLCGIEYTVILPSALPYVKSLNGSHVIMGVLMGIYPFAAMLSLPVSGYLYDKTKRLKELMVLLTLFQVIGNLIYSVPYSIVFPLVGRFIAGLGDGFMACSTSEVTHLYPKEQRIGVLSVMELGRVVGLFVGPAFNIFIGRTEFYIDYWHLDYTTLPGVIMAICWFLLTVVIMFGVKNLALTLSKESQSAEKQSLLTEERQISADTKMEQKGNKKNSPKNDQYGYWSQVLKSMFSIEFLVIFYVDVVLWTVQTQMELLVPFVTEFEYNWSTVLTSAIYVLAGLEVIVIFISMYFLSPKYPVHDAHLLIFSLVLTQGVMILVVLESVVTPHTFKVALFFSICVLAFLAVPFNLVCSRNLFTRLFSAESQGIMQGFYSAASRISMILGPVLVSLVFQERILYAAIASVFITIGIVLLACSLRQIKKKEKSIET